jgi:CRISPR-associated protein Cas2
MMVVVAYDIADDRRRNAVASTLTAIGWRVQESVFECVVDEAGTSRLWARLVRLTDPSTDVVNIYRQCRSCHQHRVSSDGVLPHAFGTHIVV